MHIKVLTNVRADSFFLDLWVRHYGSIFGRENLHVMLDGDDWTPGCDLAGVNLHVVTDVPHARALRDNFISAWQSSFARQLLSNGTKVVLRIDVDEFVAIDPQAGFSLIEFLERMGPRAMFAALGIDVIEGPGDSPLAPSRPILAQRHNAIVTHEFSKLVAVRRPPRWFSGFHRGYKVPVRIAPGLLLFHLALFDRRIAAQRVAERAAIGLHHSEAAHLNRRLNRFAAVEGPTPLAFDDVAERARAQIMAPGPKGALPRLMPITDGNTTRGYLVRLPERMAGLLPPVS